MSIRRKEQTSNSAVRSLMRGLGLEEGLLLVQVEEFWKKMMGENISRHTLRMSIEKRILFVQLDSAVLRNELNLNQSKILLEINKEINQDYFDKIKFI